MICPLCGNKDVHLVTEKLRRGEGEVYSCSLCDLAFLKPKAINVKEYYNIEYRKKFKDNLNSVETNPEELFLARYKFQQSQLDILKEYFDKSKKVLEIGCSAGQLLHHIHDKFGEYCGIELDSKCAEHVRKKYGIIVCETEIQHCQFDNEYFDYIIFLQVLEHVADPHKFLFEIGKKLKPGGKLFIEVPNLHDPLLDLWLVNAYNGFYYHEAHTFYYSINSLKKLMFKNNYFVDEVHFLQDYNFLNHLYWYFNNSPQGSCEFGLSDPKINFNASKTEIAGKINNLFYDLDKQYKKILSENELTSNIFLICSKKINEMES